MRPVCGPASAGRDRLKPVLTLLIFFTAAAIAQVKETISVHLVEVPVMVTDRNGNPVRGLTAANFEILDEGRKRPIASFDKIDFASRESMRATSPMNPAARRSFLLLFDLSFSTPAGRAKAQDAARNFIARGMQRRDLAAVATVDIEKGFRMLTAFTTDRNLLTAAIGNPHSFRSSDPLQIAGSAVYEAPTQGLSERREVSALEEIAKEVARGEKRLNDIYNRGRVERQMTQLGGMARTLRMLPGRKQVVFFSEGFDPRLVQGRDARSTTEQQEDFDLVIHGEAYKTDSDARYGSSSTLSILDRMAKLFRGSDVVLNAVDIAGIRVQNDLHRGATINSNDGLFLVSNPTGGEVFRNSNDINTNMEKLLRRQEVVYVLGFQPPSSRPGKFHELKVQLKDVYASSGFRVHHRAGYWEEGVQNVLERLLTTAEIVLNDIPQADIGVAALAASFPTQKDAQVPVIVEINGADLLRGSKPSVITIEVYIYAFDDEGLVRDRMFQRISIDPSKVADKLRESGIKYYSTLSLPEGKYAIKTLVRVPETERKGFARTDIVVSRPADVAVLPPFFFEEPGRWLMVKGGSHDPTNAGYPFEIDGESFIPSASVRVKNGEGSHFAVFVYNVTPDEVSWEATVNDAAGTPRSALPSLVKQSHAQDVTKMMFHYKPGDLTGQNGTLDFTVHKKGSPDSQKASVAFSVQR